MGNKLLSQMRPPEVSEEITAQELRQAMREVLGTDSGKLVITAIENLCNAGLNMDNLGSASGGYYSGKLRVLSYLYDLQRGFNG